MYLGVHPNPFGSWALGHSRGTWRKLGGSTGNLVWGTTEVIKVMDNNFISETSCREPQAELVATWRQQRARPHVTVHKIRLGIGHGGAVTRFFC